MRINYARTILIFIMWLFVHNFWGDRTDPRLVWAVTIKSAWTDKVRNDAHIASTGVQYFY